LQNFGQYGLMSVHNSKGAFVIKYTVEYASMAGPDTVIDGTVLADLNGWPTIHSFVFPARDDVEAMRLTKEWYSGIDKYLSSVKRYMVGEPRLLKTITLNWKT
jgi:hypothetical protein